MYLIWCHTYCGCVIIHTMGVVWPIIWGWWQRYSRFALRYNCCELRYNNFDVMSRVLLYHKSWVMCRIHCILCHIYSRYDVMIRVWVISSIQCVWSHRHRHEVCDVIYSGCTVLTQCVSCEILLTYIHKHSGCYVTDTVAVMSQVYWMRCHKLWMWCHL